MQSFETMNSQSVASELLKRGWFDTIGVKLQPLFDSQVHHVSKLAVSHLGFHRARSLTGMLGRLQNRVVPQQTFRIVRQTIEACLNESEINAGMIARQVLSAKCDRHCEYLLVSRASDADLLKTVQQFRYSGPQFFKDYGEIVRDYIGHDAPIVLANAHFGPYQPAMVCLSKFAPPARDVWIVKRTPPSAEQLAGFARSAGEDSSVNVITVGDNPAMQAIRSLRRGSTVVFFFDTPPAWGAHDVLPVRFFDSPCLFSTGIAKVAALGRAVILPVFTHYDESGTPVLTLERPIDCTNVDDVDANCKVVTQTLATHLEKWIRKHPGQWTMWPHLPTMWDTRIDESENENSTGSE
jgi:lauroyl/myristoyl acyltransferase